MTKSRRFPLRLLANTSSKRACSRQQVAALTGEATIPKKDTRLLLQGEGADASKKCVDDERFLILTASIHLTQEGNKAFLNCSQIRKKKKKKDLLYSLTV